MEEKKYDYAIEVIRRRAREHYYAHIEERRAYAREYYHKHKAQIWEKTKERRKRQRAEKNIYRMCGDDKVYCSGRCFYCEKYAMKKIGEIINSDRRKEYDGAFLCELDKESET